MPKSKTKRKTIEVKQHVKKIPTKLNAICLVCDKKLEVDKATGMNAQTYPIVYKGVVFRSSGQYGSTVLDCGVGIPRGWEPEIQIIVCDECLLKKNKIVNAFKNKRTVIEQRPFRDVAVEWSDYATFEELMEAESKLAEENS